MRRFAIALASLTMLVGCASSPPPRYYTLSAEATKVSAAPGPSVSVNATVPAMLDRPQFVVVVNANEVAILEQQRWAEPLQGEIGRVLAENLSRATGNPHIAAYPQSASLNADYRVLVDVQRFAGRLDGEVALDALWSVRAKDGTLVRRGRSSAREPVGKGYDTLVAAYSRALAKLADEIAMAVKSLPAAK